MVSLSESKQVFRGEKEEFVSQLFFSRNKELSIPQLI